MRFAESQTQQHHIALQIPDDLPFVMADQSKVEIVVNNLVTNAINYSPDGGRILIKVETPTDGFVTVSVIDEGIGIPDELVERVFERFYRIDTSDGRQVYGHGLGLYISKRLVELQGGQIWVRSKEGRGSCFSFTLSIVDRDEGDVLEEQTDLQLDQVEVA